MQTPKSPAFGFLGTAICSSIRQNGDFNPFVLSSVRGYFSGIND